MFAVSFDELHNEVEWTGYDCVDQRPVAGEERRAKSKEPKSEDERAHIDDWRGEGDWCGL